ncbi:MAG: VWA domain-containing protein, partial [Verrucomicrobiales bacterium]
LVMLTIAMAGPQNDVRIPRNRAVVMLVIDVSQSMRATDVEPSRLAAAQEALGNTQAACDLRERIQRDFPGSAMHDENLRRLNLLRFRMADAAEAENKPDEVIAVYEKLWMDGDCRSALSARAVKRWMELLLLRNHAGDRLSACRGGISFLETSRAAATELSEEDQAATEEVDKLTKRLQTELAAEARPGP